MGNGSGERGIRVTDRALEELRAEGLDPAWKHVPRRGGSGHRFSLDPSFVRRHQGADVEYDLEKETEGFWLDHEDAAPAAFR